MSACANCGGSGLVCDGEVVDATRHQCRMTADEAVNKAIEAGAG